MGSKYRKDGVIPRGVILPDGRIRIYSSELDDAYVYQETWRPPTKTVQKACVASHPVDFLYREGSFRLGELSTDDYWVEKIPGSLEFEPFGISMAESRNKKSLPLDTSWSLNPPELTHADWQQLHDVVQHYSYLFFNSPEGEVYHRALLKAVARLGARVLPMHNVVPFVEWDALEALDEPTRDHVVKWSEGQSISERKEFLSAINYLYSAVGSDRRRFNSMVDRWIQLLEADSEQKGGLGTLGCSSVRWGGVPR